jgi:hypothetical protein
MLSQLALRRFFLTKRVTCSFAAGKCFFTWTFPTISLRLCLLGQHLFSIMVVVLMCYSIKCFLP